MFCFTTIDFGFAFKLHSILKKETPLLQKTKQNQTKNKEKKNPNFVYFRLTCDDFFESYFSAQPINKK